MVDFKIHFFSDCLKYQLDFENKSSEEELQLSGRQKWSLTSRKDSGHAYCLESV